MKLSPICIKAIKILGSWVDLAVYTVGAITIFLYLDGKFPKLYSSLLNIALGIFAIYYFRENLIKPFRQGFEKSKRNQIQENRENNNSEQ